MFQEQKGKAVTVVRKTKLKTILNLLKGTEGHSATTSGASSPLSEASECTQSSLHLLLHVHVLFITLSAQPRALAALLWLCFVTSCCAATSAHIRKSTNRSTRGGFHNGMSRGVVNLTTKYYFLCVSTPSPTVRVYGNRRVNKHTCKRAKWE